VLSTIVLVPYTGALLLSGRPNVIRQLVYNAPIAFVFLVLSAEFVLIGRRDGWRRFVRANAPTLVVWLIAAFLLVLRFAPTKIELSGHTVWLPMLTVDAWSRGFPVWFPVGAGTATLIALYLKTAVFGGPSGVRGMIVGIILGAVLLLWKRLRTTDSD
jgi:hypothetical protein